DSTNWDGGLLLRSAGVLTVKPRSGGSPIQIGASGASATSMNLTVADINRIADGFSEIIIGDATAGSITTVNATTFTDNLRLMSAGNLVINGAINASGNQLALEIGGSTTQTAALTADSLRLGGDGNFTLENAANQIGTLSKDGTGSVSLTNN